MVGDLIQSSRVLKDDSGQYGLFFIFSDIALRTVGQFTFRFTLCDLEWFVVDSFSSFTEDCVRSCVTSTFSAPFDVVVPRYFPGVTDSTELTKIFRLQGIKIGLRTRAVRGDPPPPPHQQQQIQQQPQQQMQY